MSFYSTRLNVLSIGLCAALLLQACGGGGAVAVTPPPVVTQPPIDGTIGQAPPPVVGGSGIVRYVNSALGDDSFSGSAASLVAGTGTGPWRTLARLQQVKLAAADQVVLACGGVWNETLKITGSDVVAGASSATVPLVITAPTGCTSPPEINGAEALLASQWSGYTGTETSGNIFVASLPRTVLQMADGGDTRYQCSAS